MIFVFFTPGTLLIFKDTSTRSKVVYNMYRPQSRTDSCELISNIIVIIFYLQALLFRGSGYVKCIHCNSIAIYRKSLFYYSIVFFITTGQNMRECGFSMTRILPYKNRIVDSVLIQENMGQ